MLAISRHVIPFDASYVVVELNGYLADDEDQDAALGARLIIPTEIGITACGEA